MRKRLLVSGIYPKKEFEVLNRYADTYWLDELDEKRLEALLPSIDAVLVHFWPKELGPERLRKMSRLSFVPVGPGGRKPDPFRDLGESVVVSSNAGGYSEEVGEYAWGILLAAAKRIVKYDRAIKSKGFPRPSTAQLGREVMILKGRTLGIIGYGGIGGSIARFGKAFQMKILVYSRREIDEEGVAAYRGEAELRRMLPKCDFMVLALPLTKSTSRMLGREELGMMNADAVFVNIARAEIVDEQALYQHLVKNRDFVYAAQTCGGRRMVISRSLTRAALSPAGQLHRDAARIGAQRPGRRRATEAHAREHQRFLKGERPENIVRGDAYV